MLLSLARRVGDGSGEVHQEGLDAAHDSGLLRRLVDAAASARGESTDVGTVTVRAVPVINKVSCGYPRDFTDLDYPPQHADSHVSCPDVNDVDAFGFRVFGDSMEPIYRENDIVIVSPSTDPLHGDDCFVRFASGETTFKRVFFEENPDDPATPGVIRLQPRNERHPPRTVAAAEVEAVYPAVYRYERVNQRPNGRVLR
jgi:phage repressor protein C with HTH and peptisase S24 domain